MIGGGVVSSISMLGQPPSEMQAVRRARRLSRWSIPGMVLAAVVSGAVSGGVVAYVYEPQAKVTTIVQTAPPVETGPSLPDIPTIISSIRSSVVAIDVTSAVQAGPRTIAGESAGTGVVWSADGLIATNQHVISGARTVTVTLADGSVLPATIVAVDQAADLALIRVQRTGMTPLALGQS